MKVRSFQPLALHQTVRCTGPGTLAFDGERERTLKPDQVAELTMHLNGPRVLNVEAALQRAAEIGIFRN